MPKAIVLHEYGDAEVLRLAEVQVGAPGPGEILIRQTAIGVHFHDIYVRSGLYKTLDLPGTPGLEAAGVVEAVGPGAAAFKIGDRIVYVTSGYGAYATHRVLPGERAVKIPDTLSDALVATNFSRLLTVQMLIDKVTALRPEHTILVTAASGGVGRLLCQAARAAGARVIGSASTPEKAARAKDYGCAHALTYDQDDFAEEIRDLTQGNGVDIVYDSVGAENLPKLHRRAAPAWAFGELRSVIGRRRPRRALRAGGQIPVDHAADPVSLHQRPSRISGHVGGGVRHL